jgi:nitroreductase/NAD-dependent dihydropyrimidine dehydrogenase PreA subunit
VLSESRPSSLAAGPAGWTGDWIEREIKLSLFAIDQDKCQRDAICAAECPFRLIEMPAGGAFPQPIATAEEECINCGHCVAVCPHGALTLKTMGPEECLPLRPELNLSLEAVGHLITARRSIRSFKQKPVDKADLARLIEIARYAPSGHNVQPVHWLVFSDAAEVRRLAGLTADWMRGMIEKHPEVAARIHLNEMVAAWDKGEDWILRSAPHLILTHTATAEGPIARFSAIAALTYLDLAAHSMGLGACWIGYLNEAAQSFAPLQEALGLPKGHRSSGAMVVGWPKFTYQRIPLRNEAPITWRG